MPRTPFRIVLLATTLVATMPIAAVPAQAQTKPATSGKVSFNEPEMRRHRSGFKHPQHPHRGFSLRGLRR